MNYNTAKPFLKWAGGKTQILPEVAKFISYYEEDDSFTYIEPFVGSGAVLFFMLNKYPNIQRAVINDLNTDLTNCYLTIKHDVAKLLTKLKALETKYHALDHASEEKKAFYYDKRKQFNTRKSNKIMQAALFIFLNKTCFNGLYRVNSKNEFNVPQGSYGKPLICDKANLKAVSKVLQKVEIRNGDFHQTLEYAKSNSFFYLDPPYKPLSATSSFNSYSKEKFDDSEQIRLKEFCDELDAHKCQWLLSNSDVRETNNENDFFDNLFSAYTITRVQAKRSINSNPQKRGKLSELLITNIEDLRHAI